MCDRDRTPRLHKPMTMLTPEPFKERFIMRFAAQGYLLIGAEDARLIDRSSADYFAGPRISAGLDNSARGDAFAQPESVM